MAKPRKQKAEDQKPGTGAGTASGGVVLHQKLCLFVDMENRRIFGHTEMKIVVPESGCAALHADNMAIRSVSVDGEPAEFKYSPHCQVHDDEERRCSVSGSGSAADVADVVCSKYISCLDKEMLPNLLITCCKSSTPVNEQQVQENGGNTEETSVGEQLANGYDGHPEDKNVKLVRIDYLLDTAETGFFFRGNVLHTDNHIIHAHCWFPCINNSSQRCPFDLEFTVNSGLVAVSNGNLLYQTLSRGEPACKTYVYNLETPVNAEWISLAVAPFEILPDINNDIISHFCLSGDFSKLQNTVGFFHSAFSHYEDYLSTSFPFGSYKQVFLPPEVLTSSMNTGASVCIFSSELLFDEKTIDQTMATRIKLAYGLARQWFGAYIVAEEASDEWLLDGLAGFLTDSFIKRSLGNNEALYRRYKANCAVCKADVTGATALSSSALSRLHGTQSIGFDGKIRSWKAIAVLQMLEKQMGPESFRKVLQNIVSKARDTTRSMRTLSTKEFRHLANKVGNLERPFLKEFFPRWVESFGCPVLRMGLSYNKRRNMIELGVNRECSAKSDPVTTGNPDNVTREGDTGWPGMMSIRVHEIDGMYDHPIFPMSGENWQLLEIQCHSKLAAKRIQKSKKGSKPDGSDDNADIGPTPDMRTGMDSPLLWVRVDPEMEYLAEIDFHQPVPMWINQLEKDKDVVAQAQAIAMLQRQPNLSFSVVNALNSFLCDSKAFWSVRVEAAYALANTASEETDWAGLLHLVKFYKSRRFDPDTGLPRPNDFRDFAEYFVLEAIPHAIALVRGADRKSPREAAEFVLQLLKHNDNSGNQYSDVYWLAALVQSVGELEFGEQSIIILSALLKRIDRLMQVDSLMPSHNGILTRRCIHTLSQLAIKMSAVVPLENVCELIRPFRKYEKTLWKVRIEASRVLLDLKFYSKGLDAALSMFIKFLEEEPSSRGKLKLAVHVMQFCQRNVESEVGSNVSCTTLIVLLRQLTNRNALKNVLLRHYLFSILQIVAGRSPTLYGVSRDQLASVKTSETCSDQQNMTAFSTLKLPRQQEVVTDTAPNLSSNAPPIVEAPKETDAVSNCSERRCVVKIKLKQPASSSKVDDAERVEHSRGRQKSSPCNSLSVDAPIRGGRETFNSSNQIMDEGNSSHDHGSRMTVSVSNRKFVGRNEVRRDLQCTADSRISDQISPTINITDGEEAGGLQSLPIDEADDASKRKAKKDKDKERKRKRDDKSSREHHDDPEYQERKRQKKEKKRMEKELAKKQKEAMASGSIRNSPLSELKKLQVSKSGETTSEAPQSSAGPKLRIKFRSQGRGYN